MLKQSTRNKDSAGLKPCAVFDVPEAAYPPQQPGERRPFRDPAGLPILQKIAEGLSIRGYRTTQVKPAKAQEAGFCCRLTDGSEIYIVLGISRRERGLITCNLDSYHFPSWLDRWRRRSDWLDRVAEWSRLCETIIEDVTGTLGATSVLWLTENEAEEHWGKEASM